METHTSISELGQLGDKEVDPDLFNWELKKKKDSDAFKGFVAGGKNDPTDNNGRFGLEAENDSRTKTLTKLRNLGKELLFITDGYFDFDEMIWRDRSDGRALNSSEWYQDNSYHLRQGFQRYDMSQMSFQTDAFSLSFDWPVSPATPFDWLLPPLTNLESCLSFE